jgi:hypothetical protein
VEFRAQGQVDDDVSAVSDAFKLEVTVLTSMMTRGKNVQSAAVRHMFAFSSVSRLGEEPLQGSEDVLMCCHRGAGVLRATVRWSPWHRERVPFVKKITPRAPTKPNTQKPARLAIL